jgi:hypothetical protein
LNWDDETVSATRQSFNEPRLIRRIAQHFPEPIHRFIQAVVEVHKRVGRPQRPLEFFAGDQLTGALQQSHEHLEGLILQDELVTVA